VSSARLRALGAISAGLLFGAGLLLSGMARPGKVLAFLDILGDWDPSLLLVMAAAVGVHALGYRLVRRRAAPLADERFWVPEGKKVDARLLVGSALFGVGWGLAGYCPGPALVSLASAAPGVLVFVLALILGSKLTSALSEPEVRSADTATDRV
jgi:uncharacterized membrane protein YedE/YeeE